MFRYTLHRLAMTIPTLVVASLLVFVLLRVVPGDPALLIVGDIHNPEALARVRREYGFDQPVWQQYLAWAADVLRLDFGTSLSNGQPVLSLIASRFSVTALLVFLSLSLAGVLAVIAGLIAAWRRNTWLDHSVVTLAIVALSAPSFWVALLLIFVFGVKLQWLPTLGFVSPLHQPLEALRYLLMPVAALSLVVIGQVARMMRATAIEALEQDYIVGARAKGLSEGAVLRRHVFPNAFAPALTVFGMLVGTLLGGAAVIETIFTLPGLGRLLVDSIYARDYAVVQGIALLVGFVYVLVNLIVDLLYPVFDPRVRL